MDRQGVWQQEFSFGSRPIVVEASATQLSSDAGLLPVRLLDERLRFTERLAAALSDEDRDGDRIAHTFLEMTRSRVYGILAGYEDCNDHDALRSDPVFKLIAGRLPTDDDLASQPTLSRFENAIGPPSLFRLEDLLIEQFVESLDGPAGEPLRVTLDLDVFDDPTHGQQQLTFFHGFYEQYQYLPRVMTCADNDLVVMAALLPGTMHAATGVDDDLHKLVPRLRERFPHVRIVLRCDSGFATPRMYESCERLGVDYTIGLGLNATLKNLSDDCLQQAVQQFEQSGEP